MDPQEPPILLDGARVVRFALLRHGPQARAATIVGDGVPVDVESVSRIAMAEDLVDGSIIVMYCDAEWGTVAADRHGDLASAQRAADAAYAGLALAWADRRARPEEEREVEVTREFLRELARDFRDA